MKLCECGCGQAAPIATKNDRRWGWINGQPKRFVKGHQNRPLGPDFIEVDRGWATPCWIWQRHISRGGYGMTPRGTAHRAYFERFRFKVWPGHELDHLCRQIDCVHPYHLEPVTQLVNAHRAFEARRGN